MKLTINCTEKESKSLIQFYELLGLKVKKYVRPRARAQNYPTPNDNVILVLWSTDRSFVNESGIELKCLKNIHGIYTYNSQDEIESSEQIEIAKKVIDKAKKNEFDKNTEKNGFSSTVIVKSSEEVKNEKRKLNKKEIQKLYSSIPIIIKDSSLSSISLKYKPSRNMRIGVLTSGGDSPGMNRCIGTILKIGLLYGIDIVLFRNGFQGLVNDNIVEKPYVCIDYNSGGTFIGSSRCDEFKLREGRLKAVRTILKHNIMGLIVLGGDGSLRGVNALYRDWNDLIEELKENTKEFVNKKENLENQEINEKYKDWNSLIKELKIKQEFIHKKENLENLKNQEDQKNNKIIENKRFDVPKMVHIPFSIDNDIPSAYTIGTDTALEVIQKSSLNLSKTFTSHHRCYILEVMGRDTGYLSIASGISFADYIIFDTIDKNCLESNWKEELINAVKEKSKNGCVAVVLSESAKMCNSENHKDQNIGTSLPYYDKSNYSTRTGNIPESSEIKNEQKNIKSPDCQIRVPASLIKSLIEPIISTRILRLGHLQRGHSPFAFDRLVSTLSGVEAVGEIAFSNDNFIKKKVPIFASSSESLDNIQKNESNEPVSIILNHNNLIKKTAKELLFSIDNKINDSGIKDIIEKIVKEEINVPHKNYNFMENSQKKDILIIVHSDKIPGINMIINQIVNKLPKCNIFAAIDGFSGILSNKIKKISFSLNEESDCSIGYSHSKKGFKITDSIISQLKTIFTNYSSILIIGDEEILDLIKRIENNQIFYLPISKYLFSLPGTFSIFTNTVNLIDNLNTTFKNLNVRLSNETLCILCGLATGCQTSLKNNQNKKLEFDMTNQNKYKNTKNNSLNDLNSTFLARKCKLTVSTQKNKIDLRELESPISSCAWDRVLSILYGKFTAEVIEYFLFGPKKFTILNIEPDIVKFKLLNEIPNCSVKVILITDKPKVLNINEYLKWIEMEFNKKVVLDSILGILGGYNE